MFGFLDAQQRTPENLWRTDGVIYLITLEEEAKQETAEFGKLTGRSWDSPPGRFLKCRTVSQSGLLLPKRQTPATESLLVFLNTPGVLPFRSMNALGLDWPDFGTGCRSESEKWPTAVKGWSVIHSTIGRVSPKRRNCLRISSSSSEVTINQRSSTFPLEYWREGMVNGPLYRLLSKAFKQLPSRMLAWPAPTWGSVFCPRTSVGGNIVQV